MTCGAGCLLALAIAAVAEPLQSQTLEGMVLRGENGPPVAGRAVELHRVSSADGAVVDSTITGTDGSFSFALPENGDPRILWIAASRHHGILYFGPALHAGQAADSPYRLVVHDTMQVTRPPPDLRVGIRHVVVTPGREGHLDVAEVIDVLGSGDRTLVPVSDTVTMWSTSLAPGALSPAPIEGGVGGDAIRFESGRVQLHAMLAPAGARLAFGYSVPGSELEIGVEHSTERVEVILAGPRWDVEGVGAEERSVIGGQEVRRYGARDVAAGDGIRISLVGSAAGNSRLALAWALVGLAFALAAGALWWRELPGRLRAA